jgi:hypothetical protein
MFADLNDSAGFREALLKLFVIEILLGCTADFGFVGNR